MEAAQHQYAPDADGVGERERCAMLVEAQAVHFERKKLFPLARALRGVAEQIRGVVPAAGGPA